MLKVGNLLKIIDTLLYKAAHIDLFDLVFHAPLFDKVIHIIVYRRQCFRGGFHTLQVFVLAIFVCKKICIEIDDTQRRIDLMHRVFDKVIELSIELFKGFGKVLQKQK